MKRMGLGFYIELWNPRGRIARQCVLPCPIRIGRDKSVCDLVLEADDGVSRLHASLDIRQGRVVARDVRSAGGTIHEGVRLEPDRWIILGTLDQPHVLQLSDWTLRFTAQEVQSTFDDVTVSALGPSDPTQIVAHPIHLIMGDDAPQTAPMREAGQPRVAASPSHSPAPQPLAPPPASPAPRAVDPLDVMGGGAPLNEALEWLTPRLQAYRAALATHLETLPERRRQQLAEAFRVRLPALLAHPEIASLFDPSSAARAASETGAITAIQDLAYGISGNAPRTAAEVAAFTAKTKVVIWELLSGYVPLLNALETFQQELAVARQTGIADYPRNTHDLARALFDWAAPPDEAIRILRASFAELVTNQMGWMNGVSHGVKALIDEVSPAAILQTWQEGLTKKSAVARLFSSLTRTRDLWALFVARHSNYSDEEGARFRVVFGQRFADDYRRYRREAARSYDAAPRAMASVPAQRALAPAGAAPPRDGSAAAERRQP